MMLPSIAPPSATDSEVSRLANRLQQIGEKDVSLSEGNGGGSSLLPPQQQTQHQQISKEVSTSPQIAYLLLTKVGNKLNFTKDSILATVALEADVSGVDFSEGLPIGT